MTKLPSTQECCDQGNQSMRLLAQMLDWKGCQYSVVKGIVDESKSLPSACANATLLTALLWP